MPEGLVDWNMAERVARALSGNGPSWDGGEEELRATPLDIHGWARPRRLLPGLRSRSGRR